MTRRHGDDQELDETVFYLCVVSSFAVAVIDVIRLSSISLGVLLPSEQRLSSESWHVSLAGVDLLVVKIAFLSREYARDQGKESENSADDQDEDDQVQELIIA